MTERNYITEPGAQTTGTARTVPTDRVQPNRWNYNVQSEEVFTKLVESMRRFGYSQPIVVRHIGGPRYEIINGEHRWRAATALKMPTVEVFDLGDIPDTKARELAIVLNNLTGSPDEIRLADLLRDINETVKLPDMVAVMPFTERDMQHLVESVDFQFENLSGADTRSVEEKQQTEPLEEVSVSFDKASGAKVAARLAGVHENANTAVALMLAAWEARDADSSR